MTDVQPPWMKTPSRATRRKGGREPAADDSREVRVVPAPAPADAPPQSPLDFTLAVMRDPLKPDALRASLAKAALPYVHGRWCPLGSDPRDAQEKLSSSVEAHEDSLIRHARLHAGHPRLSFDGEQDVDGRVKPGHDENKERASVLEQRAVAAELRAREMEQRAVAAEARMRESEQRALDAEARLAELAARESASKALLARVREEWAEIFDASGAVRAAPCVDDRDLFAQLVEAQERARNLEERALMAEGRLREAQRHANDMEQRACASEALIAWRR